MVSTNLSFYKRLFGVSSNQNQKLFEKEFAGLAARAVFVSSFLLQIQLIYNFLAVNNYLNLPHSQGGYEIGH